VTSPTTLIAGWPEPPALLPPTHGTPSLPRRVSACSTAETASVLDTASRSAKPSAIWLQPSCPPAVSAILSAMARHVSLERSKSSRRLQHAIGEQVVEAGIGPLNDQCRQRRHGAGGALDHDDMICWKPFVTPLS
jgi:hypothetical protein